MNKARSCGRGCKYAGDVLARLIFDTFLTLRITEGSRSISESPQADAARSIRIFPILGKRLQIPRQHRALLQEDNVLQSHRQAEDLHTAKLDKEDDVEPDTLFLANDSFHHIELLNTGNLPEDLKYGEL